MKEQYVYLLKFNDIFLDDQVWWDIEEMLTSPDVPYIIPRKKVMEQLNKSDWCLVEIKEAGLGVNPLIVIIKIKVK
jgi:hypothetical protein